MQKTPLNRFLEQIEFEFAPPETPHHREQPFLASSLDRENLRLPTEPQQQNQALNQLLAQLQDLPKMSTAANACLLYLAIQAMPPEQIYLNIGVWCGYSLAVGMLATPQGHCIGVDNFSEFGGPRDSFYALYHARRQAGHLFYEMDYREYFEWVQPHQARQIGVYYYDGPHDESHQREALELAHPYLAPGAMVFIDDINETHVQRATQAFIQAHPEYQICFQVTTAHTGHPSFWNGLMLLQKT